MSIWKHKTKYRRREYTGSYRKCRGERTFVLTCGKHVVSFESWQAAKALGWYKQ